LGACFAHLGVFPAKTILRIIKTLRIVLTATSTGP
jgi:hypothetical protein